jgi:hypothetical protein
MPAACYVAEEPTSVRPSLARQLRISACCRFWGEEDAVEDKVKNFFKVRGGRFQACGFSLHATYAGLHAMLREPLPARSRAP